MNKKDLSLVVVLILMIPVWLLFDAKVLKPRFPEAPEPVPTEMPAEVVTPEAAVQPAGGGTPAVTPLPEASAPVLEVPETAEEALEAETLVLGNEVLEVEFSNLGATIVRADLKDYPATLAEKEKEDGEIVRLDFSQADFQALSYNMKGLNALSALKMTPSGDQKVSFSREVLPGLEFSREFVLGEGYEILVQDRWTNTSDVVLTVPDVSLYLGAMVPEKNISQKFGPFVGIDAKHLTTGVKHYVKTLRKKVSKTSEVYEEKIPEGVEWFGVKNKFFTQVLSLESSDSAGMTSLTLRAKAGTDTSKGAAAIGYAQPSVTVGALPLTPGQSVSQNFSYYVGPISMENLKALGGKQEELIDFRLFRFIVPLGKAMMWGLNKLEALTGNWGIAIILLTFVVRMLFWPLTQKGAENMKRMSELSPQMKELKEKYKNNPQKLNAEMSAFYKENKVNPMAGCLPMLVQIPVFISLYGVLRVAVELRFAEFLWIKDLSEQEALFPLGGFVVNILPLTMGATMVLQQRLTPSNMDEQQKKIMMMMPIVFLFICYNMPAGLLLYWTTSNLISIYQTTHTRRRDAKKAGTVPAKTGGGSKGKLKAVKDPKASKPKS
ncbi:membrane protein insertase YidC [Kiritimatiellaeota bacterium B1221]|nr:membrane protein insertase YidC [Kiritimatiellaeota bacterium B1221]